MIARRIILAVLALTSLTIGIYAQGGGGRAGGGGGRQAGPPQPGNLIKGAWGEEALTPDSRGWGWMVKQYVANAQRPLWNQAKEKLLNDGKVTSVTISSFQPEIYCEAAVFSPLLQGKATMVDSPRLLGRILWSAEPRDL